MIILFTLITSTFASLIELSAHYPISSKNSVSCDVDNANNSIINWVIENGRCYYFSNLSYSYDEAREYCRELSNNSYLAVPSSNLELRFLLEHLQFNKSFIGVNIVSNHLISEYEDITFDLFGNFTNKDDLFVFNQSNRFCVILDKDNEIGTYECEESLYFICEKEAFLSENNFGKAETTEGSGGLTTTQIVFIVIGGILYFGIPIALIFFTFEEYFAESLKAGGCLTIWTVFQIILIVLFLVGLAILIAVILLAIGLIFVIVSVFLLFCNHFCCDAGKIGEEKVTTTKYKNNKKVDESTMTFNIYSEFDCSGAANAGCECYKPVFSLLIHLLEKSIKLFFYFNKYDHSSVEPSNESPPMPQPIATISN